MRRRNSCTGLSRFAVVVPPALTGIVCRRCLVLACSCVVHAQLRLTRMESTFFWDDSPTQAGMFLFCCMITMLSWLFSLPHTFLLSPKSPSNPFQSFLFLLAFVESTFDMALVNPSLLFTLIHLVSIYPVYINPSLSLTLSPFLILSQTCQPPIISFSCLNIVVAWFGRSSCHYYYQCILKLRSDSVPYLCINILLFAL